MKSVCEVCTTAPATLMCVADDAVMCGMCDKSVHSANAVVAKHERVAFASTGEKINCDICQVRAASTREKRAKARPHELCTLAVHFPPRDTPSGRRRRDATGIPRDKSNVKSRGTKRKKNKIRRSRSRLLSLPIRRR